jgi:hypothetical protein
MSQVILGHKTLKFIKGYYYAPRFDAMVELNNILKNIISGSDKPLDLYILDKIQSSNQDFTDINNQLEEIILSGYEPLDPLENSENYLTFEAVSTLLRISFSNNCQYSLGTNEWFDLEPGEFTPTIEKGQKIYFKATGLVPNSSSGIGTFTILGKCNLSGNCNSMLFGDDVETNLSLSGKNYAFYKLFCDCYAIIDASKLILPATTLARSCYNSMFDGCRSLVAAPVLPATTAAMYCYGGMFIGCTSLVTAPELPATTLDTGCYNHMFSSCESLVTVPSILPATTMKERCYDSMFTSCKSLVTVPELPATTLAVDCYQYMFQDCTSLTTAPELPSTTLAYGCYRYMFYGCTSLVSVPSLPVTTLDTYCYNGMFRSCKSLVTAPELPATIMKQYCYGYMFEGCTSLTTAPELPATTLATYCYQNMFKGCTSLTTAPELPATTLVSSCYSSMFDGCTKLNHIKALFTTTPSSSYTSDWVKGVSSSGTFVKNVDATWDVDGVNGIPEGWDVKLNFTPTRCINLSITADDVAGRSTTTKIYWTAEVEGVNDEGNNLTVTLTGTDTSESFPQNTSTTDTIERTISYTYMGVTATTTITQGIWKDMEYAINLNNQWQSSTVANPDSSLYDGVYESFSNKGVNNTAAMMYIDINGYTDFDLYIRSYAESSFDYVMVSQLDKDINNDTSYSNTTLVKAHTRGNQKSGISIDNYTKVSFTEIDGGQHRITIVYRKDSSSHSGDDRGYILIPKNQ